MSLEENNNVSVPCDDKEVTQTRVHVTGTAHFHHRALSVPGAARLRSGYAGVSGYLYIYIYVYVFKDLYVFMHTYTYMYSGITWSFNL